jgi:hypothetical protein
MMHTGTPSHCNRTHTTHGRGEYTRTNPCLPTQTPHVQTRPYQPHLAHPLPINRHTITNTIPSRVSTTPSYLSHTPPLEYVLPRTHAQSIPSALSLALEPRIGPRQSARARRPFLPSGLAPTKLRPSRTNFPSHRRRRLSGNRPFLAI